jgi:hypothetical protein
MVGGPENLDRALFTIVPYDDPYILLLIRRQTNPNLRYSSDQVVPANLLA